MPDGALPVLDVRGLKTVFQTRRGEVHAVNNVSFNLHAGELLGVVGESGSGKSVTMMSLIGLLPSPPADVRGGTVMFEGEDLLRIDDEKMRKVRGGRIGFVFQDPMTSLNPVFAVGFQIMEPLRKHMGLSKSAARKRAQELLELVGIPDAGRRLDDFPHQFSGGMRQRVMIAIGLACDPKLIIADEPTTALDVTIQAQILQLMKDLSRRLGIAMIVITHNLGVVARYADRVNVMYAGKMIEKGTAEDIFARPRHPYTLGLLRSVPRLDKPRTSKLETIEGLPPNLLSPPPGCRFAPRCRASVTQCTQAVPPLVEIESNHLSACIRAEELAAKGPDAIGLAMPETFAHIRKTVDRTRPILQLKGLKTYFNVSRGFGKSATVKAVDDVSFDVFAGETLGLVGESGCGKTTIGRSILRLEQATDGQIIFDGEDMTHSKGEALKKIRRKVQVIFQDPFSSLNPRMKIGDIITEPILVYGLRPNKKAARERTAELLTAVGLYDYMADRYPHELSGGQRQRVGIARALALEPEFIVCDEPVSALDVSIQAQIINILENLQEELKLTYLFIAHDLAVVRHISDRVAVMYLGRVMELADRDALYDDPQHPYTKALLDAVPIPDPRLEAGREYKILSGEVPSPLNPPKGCVFNTRCPMASEECRQEVPAFREIKKNHFAACIKL